MQFQVSETIWEVDGSTLERLSGLTDVCMEYLTNQSKRILNYDPINDITSFVGEKADEVSIAMEMVLWEEMDVFMRSLKVTEF